MFIIVASKPNELCGDVAASPARWKRAVTVNPNTSLALPQNVLSTILNDGSV